MRKPIIGIISSREFNENNYFRCFQKFPSRYPKMVIEAGGIPIGILFSNGEFYEEELSICDGFIFEGGMDIYPEQIMCMHYAIKNRKPVLGICLGMQTMAGYEWLSKKINVIKSYEDIKNSFKKADEDLFLEKVNDHNKIDPFDNNLMDKAKHKIILDKESRLYKVFNDDITKVSVHNYKVIDNIFNNSNTFKVTGKSEDNVIEVVESKDDNYFLVGVQFHPELEDKNLDLFKELINQCKKP